MKTTIITGINRTGLPSLPLNALFIFFVHFFFNLMLCLKRNFISVFFLPGSLLLNLDMNNHQISWAPKSLQMVNAAMKLKDACSLEEKL